MDDKPLFQGMDELERTYAPQQLPPDDPAQALVHADEGPEGVEQAGSNEPPAAAPVANLGNAPSAAAAPPNIGHEDHGGAPSAHVVGTRPQTQARNPLDAEIGRPPPDD